MIAAAFVGAAFAIGWHLPDFLRQVAINIIRTAADAQAAHGYHD